MTSRKTTSKPSQKKSRARSTQAKEEKRQLLLKSALARFQQAGYQNTSIETITEQAGVSVGTFYLYFKNKVEVYRILNVEGAEIVRGMIEEAISWPGMTPMSQLSAVASSYLRFYNEYRGYYNILSVLHIGQKDFQNNKEMLEPLKALTDDILKIVETIIKNGIKQGELECADTWRTTTALWGMMDGIILMDIKQDLSMLNTTIEDLFKHGLEVVVNGLKKHN